MWINSISWGVHQTTLLPLVCPGLLESLDSITSNEAPFSLVHAFFTPWHLQVSAHLLEESHDPYGVIPPPHTPPSPCACGDTCLLMTLSGTLPPQINIGLHCHSKRPGYILVQLALLVMMSILGVCALTRIASSSASP